MIRPDEHVLASLDGYRLCIGPTLTTWFELPEDLQRRLNEEFDSASFDPAACEALLRKEPLWRDGWLLLAAHQQAGGDSAAAMTTLNCCLNLMPSPVVCGQVLQLGQALPLAEEMRLELEGCCRGKDMASAKIRVQQARRAAYTRGDAALAQLLGDWLVQYAA